MRRAWLTFSFVAGLAALVSWVVWSHWHSLLVAFLPLVWIFGHGWRAQRRRRQFDAGSSVRGGESRLKRSFDVSDVLKRPPGSG